jgi:F-type H+-transporting ATPase subunit epsilon
MAESTHIHAEVLTPEGQLFEGDLYQLSVRTVIGEIGIRGRHAPMLARLVPHELRLYGSEEEFNSREGTRYAAAEGWVEVFANTAVVLLSEALTPEQLEDAALKERIREAEQRLSEAEEGTAAHDVAEGELIRAKAFLAIAHGERPELHGRIQAPLPLAEGGAE